MRNARVVQLLHPFCHRHSNLRRHLHALLRGQRVILYKLRQRTLGQLRDDIVVRISKSVAQVLHQVRPFNEAVAHQRRAQDV